MNSKTSRRNFLAALGLVGVTAATARLFEPGVLAEQLAERTRTPRLTQGPFYPDHLPLDTDNDLLIVNDAITPAVGEITHLSGRIVDVSGNPVRNTTIEIWQVDHTGSYIHSHGENRESNNGRDKNFQGYGRFLTSSTGEYYFRTIKPVSYPGRTPHIHVTIKSGSRELLTTQFFIKGHPQNARDGIYRDVRTDAERNLVTLDFTAIPQSKTGELAAKGDIILGATPRA